MTTLTDMAGDLDVSTEQVLTALRIVATRAGVDDLASWAAKELEGYNREDELPSHRIWHLTVVANLYNPYSRMHMKRVSVFIPNKEHREKATIYRCRDGIGQLERFLAFDNGKPISVEHPNLAQIVGLSLNDPWTCSHAHAEHSPVHLRNIVDRARQTALKLCLECEKKGIDLQYFGGGDDTAPRDRKTWLETLKQEGTKAIVRGVWNALRDFAMSNQG